MNPLKLVTPVAAIAIALGLSGCPSTSPQVKDDHDTTEPADTSETEPDTTPQPTATEASFTEAKPFLMHLVALAKSGDATGWRAQLAPERRARGEAYVQQHFAAWKVDLMKIAAILETATVEVVENPDGRSVLVYATEGHEPERLMRVTREDGALRIDEN